MLFLYNISDFCCKYEAFFYVLPYTHHRHCVSDLYSVVYLWKQKGLAATSGFLLGDGYAE